MALTEETVQDKIEDSGRLQNYSSKLPIQLLKEMVQK